MEMPALFGKTPDGAPCFNFIRVNERTQQASLLQAPVAKAVNLAEEEGTAHLLDRLSINATSLEEIFIIQSECISPTGLNMGEAANIEQIAHKKSELFKRFIQLGNEEGVLTPATVMWNNCTLADCMALFNKKALALFALPAYLAMDWNGATFSMNGDTNLGCGAYSRCAPNREVRTFQEYFDAFKLGSFEENNSAIFLCLYGLANSLAYVSDMAPQAYEEDLAFAQLIDSDLYVALTDALIECGAMRYAFANGKRLNGRAYELGVAHVRNLNPCLMATLQASTKLPAHGLPVATTPDFLGSPEALSIFFGLVDLFNLRFYLGISNEEVFEYPQWNTEGWIPSNRSVASTAVAVGAAGETMVLSGGKEGKQAWSFEEMSAGEPNPDDEGWETFFEQDNKPPVAAHATAMFPRTQPEIDAYQEELPSGNPKKVPLIIAAVIAVVAIVGVLAFALSGDKDDSSVASASASASSSAAASASASASASTSESTAVPEEKTEPKEEAQEPEATAPAPSYSAPSSDYVAPSYSEESSDDESSDDSSSETPADESASDEGSSDEGASDEQDWIAPPDEEPAPEPEPEPQPEPEPEPEPEPQPQPEPQPVQTEADASNNA